VSDPSGVPTDIATPEHWDAYWTRSKPPRPFGTRRADRVLRDFIGAHLQPRPAQRFLEVGAGNSPYLPAFARTFGYQVAGLDYSPLGVDMARRNLASTGVDGDVIEADLFDPPSGWEGAFDVVFTMGVVEHFRPTVDAVRACARYLAPNGRMLTVIPNMHGFPGAATRWLSRELYEGHVAMTPNELAAAHAEAGLQVQCASYLVTFDGRVSNPRASPSRWKRAIYIPLLYGLTQVIWTIEDLGVRLRPREATSPWVVVVAQAGPSDSVA
jgi:cyclopropane fatty-acyl-phospholipid synthase-like methyltransferase